MSGDHDLGGDYGYDLVREAATVTWTMPVPRGPVSGAMGTARDAGGDYGYDQAHER